DDGSVDGSGEVIAEAGKSHENLRIITHEKNKGIGESLRSGYDLAEKELVVTVPADGQFDIFELSGLPGPEDKSFISFYRKENTSYSIPRKILSWFNKVFNNVFLGVNLKDVNWIKVYQLKELRKFNLELTSSLVETEICGKLIANGNKLIQVESKYLERKAGKSKGASLKIVSQAIADMLKLVRVIRRFKRKIRSETNEA
ncbi:MAG: glycosyltransferase, partial [Bacteroidetes bacterium]|nr:glycosyltransferase [Bacteroidota bacterium]